MRSRGTDETHGAGPAVDGAAAAASAALVAVPSGPQRTAAAAPSASTTTSTTAARPLGGGAAAVAGGTSGGGRVLTREGWPVPGASVTLLDADGTQSVQAMSGSDGSFTLVGVPVGAATMLVAAPAHEPRASTVVVPAGGSWAVGEVRLRRQGGSDVPPPGTWAIDVMHSTITATAHHLGLSAVHGRFTDFSGVITVPEDVTRATVEVSIEAVSIDTGNAQRDEHLRSPDFLDAARFPTLTFTASGVRRGAEGWVLAGDLTLLGTTRPVRLQLSHAGSGPDPWGGTRAAFSATTELRRDDFAMNWNQAVGIGVAVFGTTLRVAIDVEAVLQPTSSQGAA